MQVDTYQAALDVCDRPHPESDYEARFSLYHTVAAALENGHVDFASFDAAARSRLANLRDRITVTAGETWLSAYPATSGARVSEMLDKAKMLLDFAGCDRNTIDNIVDGVLSLAEQGGGDIVEFINGQFQ